MRILACTTYRRVLGGAEAYLAGVLPGLIARGNEVALAYELDAPAGRPLVFEGSELHVGEQGDSAYAAARAWRPDVVYLHGVRSAVGSAALRSIAPVVAFAHDYAGACISGLKTWQSVPRPCSRPLGPACLVHYFPHRCGGLDPTTMWRAWREQRARQSELRAHAGVVVASRHMRDEMYRQGVEPSRVHAPPLFVPGVEKALRAGATPPAPRRLGPVARLLSVGRLDRLKGVDMLLDALAAVARALGRPVRLVVAGDGPEAARLRERAALVRSDTVGVDLVGWCDDTALAAHMDSAELLVVPSIWPEPFGLVGPEAGIRGVPAVAFDVGGIRAWLVHGANGRLVSAERLHSDVLADAIADSLRDDERWNAARRSAYELAARFTREPHVDALARIFEDAIASLAATNVAAPPNPQPGPTVTDD